MRKLKESNLQPFRAGYSFRGCLYAMYANFHVAGPLDRIRTGNTLAWLHVLSVATLPICPQGEVFGGCCRNRTYSELAALRVTAGAHTITGEHPFYTGGYPGI